jgi:hypothetical protein
MTQLTVCAPLKCRQGERVREDAGNTENPFKTIVGETAVHLVTE